MYRYSVNHSAFFRSCTLTNIYLLVIPWIMKTCAFRKSLSGTANWSCEVRFRSKADDRHISPYIQSITFLLHISPHNFTSGIHSCYNLRYLKCSILSETLINSFWKDRREILLSPNNKQTLRGNDVCIVMIIIFRNFYNRDGFWYSCKL